ncbi:glycine--tRNA ligase [Acidianus ambivalens]|uniref:glycine--tRNA ligase n=1 Tax=Acidianus ambivalens TaxID=2283 RepID=A0A650CXD8_ACIAM|nr:glycine--tRNA ligase [Acidianus ambivalens]MQL54676.1 glycine--tRNA ligase [Acidianus ambivalens]QGR22476.1 glycine--tRNA ligase [Acidianus ambivalens]
MSEEKVIELAKRRGIFWPSYEIYGGVGGLYDIGPIGTRIKNKIVQLWRKIFVEENSDFVVEIETPMITPKKVFEASGHLENFTDPIVECNKCHRVFRADHLVEEVLKINAEGLKAEELTNLIREKNIKCPVCGGDLGDVRYFNLLFSTNIGPYTGSTGFLRPETAQGMFTSFKRVYESTREKLPLGIAQVGRVARNEISPRQGLIRMREFTIMEIEFFMDPEDTENVPLDKFSEDKINVLPAEAKIKGEKPSTFKVKELVDEKIVINPWMAYWMATANKFVRKLGVPLERVYFEEKLPSERAHYSSQTFDQMVIVGEDKVEISGHAYRGDYDLSRHSKSSGQDLSVFKKYDQPKIIKKKIVIINKDKLNKESKDFVKEFMKRVSSLKPEEVEKILNEKIDGKEIKEYVTVTEREEKESGKRFIPHVVEPSFGVERCLYISVLNAYREKKDRIVLSLPREIAPYEVAVFPLLERDELISRAREIYSKVKEKFDAIFDDSGSIGKRYARADEIGIPYAITVDPQTLQDNTVTIRDRDTWNQIRVKEEELINTLEKLFSGEEIIPKGSSNEPG